jgi:hypothetical protein
MTSSTTSPKQFRAICLFLSSQLESDFPLSDQQRKFLAKVFRAIGEGEDPRVVFGQSREPGESKLAELKVEKIGAVIQSIATDLTLAKLEGKSLLISTAIKDHLEFANSIMGYNVNQELVITEQKIRRWWDNPKYKYFKNPCRGPLDLTE